MGIVIDTTSMTIMINVSDGRNECSHEGSAPGCRRALARAHRFTSTQSQIETTDTAHQSPECSGKQSLSSASTIFQREIVSQGNSGARNTTLISAVPPLSVRGTVTCAFDVVNPGAISGSSTRLPRRITHRADTSSESTRRKRHGHVHYRQSQPRRLAWYVVQANRGRLDNDGHPHLSQQTIDLQLPERGT